MNIDSILVGSIAAVGGCLVILGYCFYKAYDLIYHETPVVEQDKHTPPTP